MVILHCSKKLQEEFLCQDDSSYRSHGTDRELCSCCFCQDGTFRLDTYKDGRFVIVYADLKSNL